MVIVSGEQFKELMAGDKITVILSSAHVNRRLLSKVGKCEATVNAKTKEKMYCEVLYAWRDTEFNNGGLRPIVAVTLKRKLEEGEHYESVAAKPVEVNSPVVSNPVEKPTIKHIRFSGVDRTYNRIKNNGWITADKGFENVAKGDWMQITFNGSDCLLDHVLYKCTERKEVYGADMADILYVKEMELVKREGADLL